MLRLINPILRYTNFYVRIIILALIAYTVSEEAEIREIDRKTGNRAVVFLHNGSDGPRQARAIGFLRGYLTAV